MSISKRFKMKNGLGSKNNRKFEGASAPSVSRESPDKASQLTDKYRHISTAEALEVLARYGWTPVSSTQKRRSSDSPKAPDSVKHIVELQNPSLQVGETLELGQLTPTLYLMNSHDGSSSLRVHLGFFRLVCLNGLCVGEEFGSFSVRHYGKGVDELEQKLMAVATLFQDLVEKIKVISEINCTLEMRKQLALKALELKYGVEVIERIEKSGELGAVLASISRAQRLEDAQDTVWTVFNVIDEDIQNGLTKLPKVVGCSRTVSINNMERKLAVTSDLLAFAFNLAA